MKLGTPTLGLVNDDGQLLQFLRDVYEEIKRLSTPAGASPITLPTHQALRGVIGDLAGSLGPRASIVTGRAAPLDGGQGIYVWDPTSTLADDDAATLQPNAIADGKPGRWRKGSF